MGVVAAIYTLDLDGDGMVETTSKENISHKPYHNLLSGRY
jgi:hypothetical protein